MAYVLHDSPGKTRTSRRAVDLDPLTIEILRTWKARRVDESDSLVEDDDCVFASPTGEPIHPDNFSKSFERIVSSAGIPRLRLHDLRHTHASLLLKERVPIKVVSERLGHATPGFTMATYQHVLPGMQADAARVFAGLIGSTGFNPVEGSVERPFGAVKSSPEGCSDLDFLVAGGGFEPPTFGL